MIEMKHTMWMDLHSWNLSHGWISWPNHEIPQQMKISIYLSSFYGLPSLHAYTSKLYLFPSPDVPIFFLSSRKDINWFEMNITNIQYFKTFKKNVTFDAFVMESTMWGWIWWFRFGLDRLILVKGQHQENKKSFSLPHWRTARKHDGLLAQDAAYWQICEEGQCDFDMAKRYFHNQWIPPTPKCQRN